MTRTMASPSDSGTGAFAETRRALLDALEQGEQQLREQAADIVRRAEDRAREIGREAEQRATELEVQLAALQQEIGNARARLASIRVRASGSPPLRSVEAEHGLPRSGASSAPTPLFPETRSTAHEPRPAPPEPRPAQAAQTAPMIPMPAPASAPAPAAQPPAQPAPAAVANTPADADEPEVSESPRETLRALRSALEGSANRST